MGGTIGVESTPGFGATFRVTFKDIDCWAEDEFQFEESEEKISYDQIKFLPQTIIVADDDELNRKLIKEFLNGTELIVIEASNGQEVLDLIDRVTPDLILIDTAMPILDGMTTTKVIKNNSRFKTINVVALTAHAMKEEEDRIRESGVDGYLTKPLPRTLLLKELTKFLKFERKIFNFEGATSNNIKGFDFAGIWNLNLDNNLKIELINLYLEDVAELITVPVIRKIKELGTKISEFGYQNSIAPFFELGTHFVTLADNFRVLEINKDLKQFLDFLNEINELSKKENEP
jgi:CheY-like chemotaxis protein